MGNNFIIDGSFQLVRTNPRLTSNVKIMVDSTYNIYLESFNTNAQLSDSKYKHYMIGKDTYYEDKIPAFYDSLPTNLAFDVKYDNDDNIQYNEYIHQYDDIYFSGVKKVEQNQFYTEEFEYFAPLYIKTNSFPTHFIILRVDRQGVYEKKGVDLELGVTNNTNFRTEIIDKWKCVNVFDLTYQTNIGYWINRNYIKNSRFPVSPLEMDFKQYNNSRFRGIDFNTGVYTEKSLYINDKLIFEQPHFKLEEYINDSWKNNDLIFPNIINFNFLFDDTPATPFQLNKYSINRYLGFYAKSLDYITTVTPYKQPELINNFYIRKNIFLQTINNNPVSVNPFKNLIWNDKTQYFIFAKNKLNKVIRVLTNGSYVYKIISRDEISETDITNKFEVDILFQQTGNTYKNYINPRNNENFIVDSYIDDRGLNSMYGDLYLVKINNKYHVLEYEISDNGNFNYYIRSDYGFTCDNKNLKYWIVDINNIKYSNNISVENDILKSTPMSFDIFKVKFCDIKDFDFDRFNTHYADFDFDKSKEYSNTSEHKLYVTNLMDDNTNKEFKKYPLDSKYSNKVINVSSEYISTNELYEISKQGLNNIWVKNQYVSKWGYSGSISHSDYPYKINNSYKVGSTFNKTCDVTLSTPNVMSKTNDFFYRIGNYYRLNDSNIQINERFKTQTLSIETETYNDLSKEFNLDIYTQAQIDYFDYFFRNTKMNENNNLEETNKYSIFVNGTAYNPSNTLFKGIKINLRGISNTVLNTDNTLKNMIIDKRKIYNDYKLSIITNIVYNPFYITDDNPVNINTTTSYNYGVTDSFNLLENNNQIHVFLNEKFKNVLIILNINTNVDFSAQTFNNLDYFDGRESIYDYTEGDKTLNNIIDSIKLNNPNAQTLTLFNYGLITAYNFINAINNPLDSSGFDAPVKFYYIDYNGIMGYTQLNNLNNSNINKTIWNNNFPPYSIDCESPDLITSKKNSQKYSAIKGPKYNIYDKYKKDWNEMPYSKSDIKDPLATYIQISEDMVKPKPQTFGENQQYYNTVYRFSGAYEPIFKNIEIFKGSDFYLINNNIFNINNMANNVFIDEGSLGIGWLFQNKLIGVCDNDFCYCELYTPNNTTVYSKFLLIDNFNLNIPIDSIINNISFTISKKSNNSGTYSGVYDSILQLKTGLTSDSMIGNNMGQTSNKWDENLQQSIYSGTLSDWGVISLTPEDINNERFGIALKVQLTSNLINQGVINSAFIDCVSININYSVNGIETGKTFYSFFEKNTKFNTDFENFGIIEEFMYSKVNENENVLKLKNATQDLSIYPMIDEYGYAVDKKFIFKSTWDSDFYNRTTNNIIDKNENI